MSDSDIQASGGDYTNLQDWLTDKDGETGTHTANVADEYITGTCTLNNASTAATAFIIKPKSGARHEGVSRNVSGTSKGAALANSATNPCIWWFSTNGASITIQDMVLEQSAGTAGNIVTTANGGNITIIRCVVEMRGTASGVNCNINAAKTMTVQDSVIYGHSTFGIDCRAATDQSIIGNTVGDGVTGSYGILPATGSSVGTVANNIVLNHSTEEFFGTSTNTNHGSNITNDGTYSDFNGAGGGFGSIATYDDNASPTVSSDYVCFTNLTAGSEDFHQVDLEDGTYDNVALANGIPSIGSGFDIDNEARDGSTPDIGADEIAGSGPSFIVPKPFVINQSIPRSHEW